MASKLSPSIKNLDTWWDLDTWWELTCHQTLSNYDVIIDHAHILFLSEEKKCRRKDYKTRSSSHSMNLVWFTLPHSLKSSQSWDCMLVLEPIIQPRQGPLYTAMNEWGLYILLVTCCKLTRRQPWGTPWVGQSDQHKTAWTRERRRSLGFHVGAVPQWSSSPPLHRALLLSQDHDTNLGTHPEVVPLWMEHNQKHFYQLNAEFQ